MKAASFLIAAFLVGCTGGGGDDSGIVTPDDGGTDAGTPTPTPAADAGTDPTPPSAATYATSCTQASDCVLVKQPVSCAGASCGCPSAAIASSDADRYNSDLTAYETTCAARYPSQKCAADCIADTALCCANKCVAKNGASASCN